MIDYQSLEMVTNSFKRTPLYKRIMQRMQFKWIGLKLNPPLLLGLQEGREEAREEKVWT